MTHPRFRIRPVLCALLLCTCLPVVAQDSESVPPDPSRQGPGELPLLYLLELSVEGIQGISDADSGLLRRALEQWWQAHGSLRLRLVDALGEAGTDGAAAAAAAAALRPALRLTVRGDPAGCLLRVSLLDHAGRRTESRTTVYSSDLRALAPALGGEILTLWMRARGYPEAQYAPPRLTALLELSTLAALDQGPGPESEPLDCAAGAEGPIVLFRDRVVGLGRRFELTPAAVRDLSLRDRLPEGFIPSHVAADPWGEAVVYGQGAVFRYEPEGATPVRTPLTSLEAQDVTGLAGGGIAVLSPGRLSVMRRRDESLITAEAPLPSAFFVALDCDSNGRLWLYDLAERKIRLMTYRTEERRSGDSRAGQDREATAVPAETSGLVLEELGSIKPLASPEALPFPQLLRVFPDGGFALGGAGELWRFDAAGWPLWRLREFRTGVRQSLPAFYRMAVDGERSFYLLDPLSRRLLRFVDLDDSPAQYPAAAGPRFPGPPPAADVELASLFRRWGDAASGGVETGGSAGAQARAELIETCLSRGLLLMARSLLSGDPGDDDKAGWVPEHTLPVTQARLLSELAGRYEEELLLPRAEQAYNAALRMLRALRAADPVDPDFPQRIRELERRRNSVREILVEVPPLELLAPALGQLEPGGRADGGSGAAGGFTLNLRLHNVTREPMRELRVRVRIPGLPGGPLEAELPRVAGGGTVSLGAKLGTAAPEAGGLPPREDLCTRVLVLVTATVASEERTFWLEAPIVVPALEPALEPVAPPAAGGR